MQMHTVPASLIGGSLGDAHKWVRQQMVLQNPSKPMADYSLTNQNGQRISLSDLTRGTASHVTINAAGGVRGNPSSIADIRGTEIQGFLEIPQPMHAHRLTALTQRDITPALYNAMVNEFGLFGATQTLSILLSRPVSPSLHHTQKTANLIRARKGESLLPLHKFVPTKKQEKREQRQENRNRRRNTRNRSNPRLNPSSDEARSAATALGLGSSVPAAATRLGRAGALGLTLDRTTQDVRREIDSLLDDVEDSFESGEAGALVSVANRMAMRYENSKEIFDNFAKNVLAPYLITSTANINALKYINEYILPAMREIIGSSDKKRRKLDRQYRHIVEKLATNPKDFYMGTELALIAHPSFLFPRAGLVLMPVPKSTKDMAFKTFQQAGTPPTYDPRTGFIATIDKSDKAGVAYIDRESVTRLGRRTFGVGRNVFNVNRVIDNLVNVIERYGETDSTGFNVLVRETRSMAQLSGEQLHQRIAGMPVFYFVDLPGIRPIPTNWPQNLIMSMMEVLGQNRDRISGLGGGAFEIEEFLTPSGVNLSARTTFGEFDSLGEWRAEFNRLTGVGMGPAALCAGGPENDAALKVLESLSKMAKANGVALEYEEAGLYYTPVAAGNPNSLTNIPVGTPPPANIRSTMLRIGPAPHNNEGPYNQLHEYLDLIIDQNLGPGIPPPGGPLRQNYAPSFHAFLSNANLKPYLNRIIDQLVPIAPITAQAESESPSVYQIMLETVELSMRKYNYNPTKDDIYFVTVLLYYSLREMGLDGEVTGFMTRISNILQRARTASMDKFIRDLQVAFPVGGPPVAPLAPGNVNAYLALKFAYEAFNDPTSDAFRALTGVRVNPAPVVTDSKIEEMKATMKKSIDAFEEHLGRVGPGSNAEAVLEALETMVMPSILKQMREDESEAMFTYAGKSFEQGDKIIESVNDLFGKCQTAVMEHIDALTELAAVLADDRPGDKYTNLVTAVTEVKGTTQQLEMLADLATAMDDFMKFLPKSVGKLEKAYVRKIKTFMITIDDDLMFDTDSAGDLTKKITEHKDDADTILAFSTLAALIREANEMHDISIAFEATIDPYNDYSASDPEAGTRYTNAGRRHARLKRTNMTTKVSALYKEVLKAAAVMCDSLTLKDDLASIVGGKEDIPVIVAATGVSEANLFSDFVKGEHSTTIIHDLHKTDKLTISRYNDFKVLFLEPAPQGYGRTVLEFIEEVSDEVDMGTKAEWSDKAFLSMESQIDTLYQTYEKRAKKELFQKNLKANTYQKLKAGKEKAGLAWTGIKRETPRALKTAGFGIGALGRSLYEGTKEGGKLAGAAIAGTGTALAGAMLGAGVALAGAAIGGGLTVANFMGSLSISAAISTYAYIKTRRELYDLAMKQPEVVEAYAAKLEARARDYAAQRDLAASQREERAAELKRNMAALGAERMRLTLQFSVLAKKNEEQRAAEVVAKLERTENEIAQILADKEAAKILKEAEIEQSRLDAELEEVARIDEAKESAFKREEARLDREAAEVQRQQERAEARNLRKDTIADLEIDLIALRRKKQSFENDHFNKDMSQPLSPEMRRKYGGSTRQTAATRLSELSADVSKKLAEIRRLQGRA